MKKIICAAVKTSDGLVHSLPKPNRHADIVYLLDKTKRYSEKIIIAEGEQGFITNDGEFVNRIEAGRLAMISGQVDELEFPPQLFSEDLW